MKTSFYFVLWILIYPLLSLFNNNFINNNSFIVALAVVWGLSWILNKVMPGTLQYESASQIAPILEEIYTGNVQAFKRRLSRETWVEFFTAIYFCVTTVVVFFAVFQSGVNDWIALIIFAIFTITTMSRSVALEKAHSSLKENLTPEKCIQITEETYKLDYNSYYEGRKETSLDNLLPPRPRHFRAFLWTSILFAAVAALLGLIYIIFGVIIMLRDGAVDVRAIACMYLLYGSLAAYFGIRDFISILHSLRHRSKTLTQQ